MIDLIQGQRVTISNNLKQGNLSFLLTQSDNHNTNSDLDLYLFPMDSTKILNKNIIIYYGNPKFNDSIFYSEDFTNKYEKKASINFSNVSQRIEKIYVGCSIFKNPNGITTNNIDYTLTIIDLNAGTSMYRLSSNVLISENRSILFGEIYKYKDAWKFRTLNSVSNQTIFQLIKKAIK